MLRVCHDPEVFRPVVKRVVVNVVHNLAGKQLASHLRLCNDSMLVLPAPRCVNLDQAVHKTATVLKSRCTDWMRYPRCIKALPAAFGDFWAGRSVLAFGAALGVVKRLAVCPLDFSNRLSAGCTWLGGKLFRHAIMYTNFIRSASCQ